MFFSSKRKTISQLIFAHTILSMSPRSTKNV